MVLYTCPARTHGASAPLIKHPCGVAAQALDAAGHSGAIVDWAIVTASSASPK
jgi:hypothetical protein